MTSDQKKERGRDGTGSAHVSNATWLFIGLVGRDCCRNAHAPCHQICKIMWRIWILLIAVFLFASALMNLGIVFWRFQPMEDHADFFLVAKMKRMLILGPRLVPFYYGIVNLGCVFVALWIFTMVFVPCFWIPILFGMLRLVQKILGLSIMLLLVLEVVYGWGEWPDETYVGSLEKKLMLDLQKQDVVAAGGVSSAWTNTQKLFGCCGVHSYQDWFNVSKNVHRNKSYVHVSGLRILPFSCCRGETEADFCYEVLSASWNERGCLSPQINELKVDWLFLTISTVLLLLSHSALTRVVRIFFGKFQPGPETRGTYHSYYAAENQKLLMERFRPPFWEKPSAPPTYNRKAHRRREDEERKPLLKSWSDPQAQARQGGQGILSLPLPSSTSVIYKASPSSGLGNQASSHVDMNYSRQSGSSDSDDEFVLGQVRPVQSRPLIPSPPQAKDPPQIYFPTRTDSGGSRGQLAPTSKRPAAMGVGSSNRSMLDHLLPREVTTGDTDEDLHTPPVGSIPMLLQD